MKGSLARIFRSFVAVALLVGCSTRATTITQPPPETSAPTDAPARAAAPRQEARLLPSSEAPLAESLFASPAEASEPTEPALPEAHPLAELSREEIVSLIQREPERLGSVSIGRPDSGRLMNGVQLPDDQRWVVVDQQHAYGTRETVEFLRAAVKAVNRRYPESPRVHIGHISGPKGGRLSPHRSHQSGRDVDVGFYYVDGEQWYRRGTKDNLDLARTWALIKAFVTETDVRFILVDHRIQALLRAHAVESGEDPAWVRDLFDGTKGKSRPLIRHASGHATHMHVRFYNPIAQETARLSYQALVQLQLVEPPTHYINHRVRKGETLIHLAKRYGTSVKAIKRANRLRSNKIIARKSYKIPHEGPASAGAPIQIPPRRYPPGPDSGQEQVQGG